jgi:hypothetical protein
MRHSLGSLSGGGCIHWHLSEEEETGEYWCKKIPLLLFDESVSWWENGCRCSKSVRGVVPICNGIVLDPLYDLAMASASSAVYRKGSSLAAML